MIAVATIVFDNPVYAEASLEINRRYCAHHGYHFEVLTPPALEDRHRTWFKVKQVQSLLQRFDTVLFIDADACFVDFTKRIETVIDEYMGDSLLMFSDNMRSANVGWNDKHANTGVWIARAHPRTDQLLTDWYAVPSDCKWQHTCWKWPIEQTAFNEVILPRYADVVKLIPTPTLAGWDGKWICHLMGLPDKDRANVFERLRIVLDRDGTLTRCAELADLDVTFVKRAVERTLRLESGIADDAAKVQGFASLAHRHLLNNLCNFIGCNYVEIGCYYGASVVAAASRNSLFGEFTTVDNFVEWPGEIIDVAQVKANLKHAQNITLVEGDALTVDLPCGFNVLYVDGDHTFAAQRDYVLRMFPRMAKRFILIVDDYDWTAVSEGTEAALQSLPVNRLFERHLPSEEPCQVWWNRGVYVALLEK